MVISNLNYVEVISEEQTVEGGFASSIAAAVAAAQGQDLSATASSTQTLAQSFVGFNQSASVSGSSSQAV